MAVSKKIDEENYYSILGLPLNADKKEIKKIYLKHVKNNLPVNIDIGNKGQLKDFSNRLSDISKAYKTLIDDDLRREYDSELKRKINFFVHDQIKELKELIIRGEWEQAEESINKSIKLTNSEIIRDFRSMINIYKGRQVEFNLKICIKFSEKNPFQSDFHAVLAYAYFGMKDLKNAKFYLMKALKWDPDNILAVELEKKVKKISTAQAGFFSKFTDFLSKKGH